MGNGIGLDWPGWILYTTHQLCTMDVYLSISGLWLVIPSIYMIYPVLSVLLGSVVENGSSSLYRFREVEWSGVMGNTYLVCTCTYILHLQT